MKKKRAILNFAGLIFLALVVVVLSVVKFTIPGTSNEYVGFLRAINLGVEYKGGVKITMEAKNNSVASGLSFADGVNAHILRMKSILADNSFTDYEIYSIANNNIVIEATGETTTDDILQLINNTSKNTLSFKAEDSATAEAYITADDLESCYGMEYNGSYYVYITFNENGKTQLQALSNAVKSDGTTVYIYIGDTKFKEISNVNSEMTNGVFMFDGGSTLESANETAGRILATKYDFSFEKLNETIITTEKAQQNLIISCVISGVIVLACLIWLIVKFKRFGLVNAFSLIIGLLVQIIMLQAVPIVTLTSTALIASVLTFVIAFALVYYMLCVISKEYAVGKKVHSSIKFGFQKSATTILEIMLSMLVASIVFYIFGSTLIKHFALALIIGTIIYGLCALVVSRWFNKMCFDLNGNHAKRYGFKREEGVDELEEI